MGRSGNILTERGLKGCGRRKAAGSGQKRKNMGRGGTGLLYHGGCRMVQRKGAMGKAEVIWYGAEESYWK